MAVNPLQPGSPLYPDNVNIIDSNFQDLDTGKEDKNKKDDTGGYVGMTLFKINFKNTLNTFTSFFTNSNTRARTYIFPDKDGTISLLDDLDSKQDTLVSGTNIKSINGQSLLGAGDIEITSGGGGGFTPVYLTNLTSTTNPAYKQSSYTPDVAETIISTVTNNNEVLARTYIFDGDVGLTTINAGTWAFDIYAYVSSAIGTTKIRLETFKRTAGGTETTLFSVSSNEINNLTTALINFTTTQGVFTCNTTDRLGTRIYVNTTANINITASYIVGDGNASFFTTPLQLRASQVRNTPAGNILSTDVQGAINELDSEKARLSGATFTGNITQEIEAIMKEIATPTNPASGYIKLYGKNDDKLYKLTSAGVESLINIAGDDNIGYLNIPQNSQSANYTLVLTDSGKHIYHPSADTTARTITIPANSSVAFPIGTAITFVNDTSAGVLTIAITSDTLVLAGAGTTGSRTLRANGIATAIKVTSTRWQINGTGLS